RAHPGRQRPRGARGDRRLHGPLRRQPSRPQAAGRRRGRGDRAAAGRERALIRTRFFVWEEPRTLAARIRAWATSGQEVRDVDAIRADVAAGEDAAVLELTARYDATEHAPESLRVDPGEIEAALEQVEPALRES